MKQAIILFAAGTASLLLFVIYGGIGFDREWNDSTVFMKHKPKFQIFFSSDQGESDRTKTRKDLVYEEYFEKNSKKGLHTLLVYLFIQSSMICYIIFSYLLIFKIKDSVIDIVKVLLFIFYGIFIKLFLYVFAWNIWGMGSEMSYIPLLTIMIGVDVLIFWIQRESIVKINNE